MPRLHLEVSEALVVSVLASLLVRFLARKTRKDGSIHLPLSGTGDSLAGPHDPFDVTTASDFVHGQPIDAEGFWREIRLRKVLLTTVLFIALVAEAVSLGWCAASFLSVESTIYCLRVVFSLYVVGLAILSINQNSERPHTSSILHLTTLLSIATALLGTIAILPSDPPPIAHLLATDSSFGALRPFWYASLVSYAVAALICFTTRLGPRLHYPPEQIYSEKTMSMVTNADEENVCGITGCSPWSTLVFSYTTKVVMLGHSARSLEIADLPILSADMRSTVNFSLMTNVMRNTKVRIGRWKPRPGSGWTLLANVLRVNATPLAIQMALAAFTGVLYFGPAFFMQKIIAYLEADPNRTDRSWGWVYVAGIFGSNAITYLATGQLWSISTTTLQCRIRSQINSILYAKTLVRKDVASSTPSTTAGDDTAEEDKDDENENNFSSKAQVMTLMTTDVDRISEFSWYFFALIDDPVEIVIGAFFLYRLLGVSSFIGLAATCLFLPMNHFAGKVEVKCQDDLMKARDERVALMNEILGGIRMLKFMAWERSFEKRVLKIRQKELKFQKLNFTIETLWNAIWSGSPILVTLISFWHFTIIRKQELTPSIAFTSISVFNEMKTALNALPETFISMLQSFVSLRRVENYLNGAEVVPVPPISHQTQEVALQSATFTWPRDRLESSSTGATPSAVSTPRHSFVLVDVSLRFPRGELSLVCGKLGSGKTLLLLALLGEADVLTGQIICPRSPPDSLAAFAVTKATSKDWVVEGICAYVPQAAWLRNASIKDNILFNLPFDEERYQKTLEGCALLSDLKILEDGDETEIGERGINLSGGQKARVSLARAVYSRAAILLLDDVLSAVDAHTAHHLYHECLKGELMKGRTVILVSHHVQLCAPGAGYVVALDNGRVQYEGTREGFQRSEVMRTLIQSGGGEPGDIVETKGEELQENNEAMEVSSTKSSQSDEHSKSSSTAVTMTEGVAKRKIPRKLIEEETRAVGRIKQEIWLTYLRGTGGKLFWVMFIVVLALATLSPVAENGWLKNWSNSVQVGNTSKSAVYYMSIYAVLTLGGLFVSTLRWFILYDGSIRASTALYEKLLETVLFTNIRFHDTISRGRLLNRFGKDFEGIDSKLSDNFGRSLMNGLSIFTTFVTVSFVGGPVFIFAAAILGFFYWNIGKAYGQTSRDMRRLDSVTRSPLYSIYGETISGVAILRAFGASSKFLRDMLRCVDTNSNPYYWMWGVNRWLSVRFNLLSSAVVGVTAMVVIITPSIDASLAGFALAFASTVTSDLLLMVRRFVSLEQSMVAVERVKEFSDLPREGPEYIEPRPPSSWPSQGAIECEDLVIRYAPELPNVLHNLRFSIRPGEKVGILGRTGSGKSTLALSFFRFVEATEGRILIDGLDIAQIGLSDLRNRLTIIPQDPTVLSGTLRSTLDVFGEYEDVEIYEALRRVQLLPSEETIDEEPGMLNANIFRNLDAAVSEGGENFSTGEKQLLCMARAILKRSKVLVMDEATASVDYATDELISKTIRHEFADSTILTIAHRLRTVIDYDRVMLLEEGRILEFEKPGLLLRDPTSKFYGLCKASGKEEFNVLRKTAGI